MTRSMESIGSKSRSKNKNEYQKGILMRCVEVEMTLYVQHVKQFGHPSGIPVV